MKQISLFENGEIPLKGSLIKVDTGGELSKESESFQKKVAKIEKMQKENGQLRATLESIRIRLTKALTPLSDEFCDLRVKSLKILDEHAQSRYFRANEKRKIKGLIIDGARDLIEIFRDGRGKDFYDKYSELSFDEQEETLFEDVKSIFEGMYEALGLENPEREQPHPRKKRKKKTKAELYEEKMNLESKSIYRDLMKNLHPDLEQDEERHKEKTEVAKKVSAAYKENNIYELLKLRSEFLDKSVGQDDLKLYTSELNKKIRELEYEKYQIKDQYKDIYENFYSTNPKVVARRINSEKKGLKQQIQIELEHTEVFRDKGKLKAFLKKEVQLVKKRPQDFESRIMDVFFSD